MPFVGGPNTHITNPRWRTAAILKNRKSPYLGRGWTDFDQIRHGDAVRPSSVVRPLKITKIKIHDSGDRHLEKSKYRHMRATVGPFATKFGTLTQFDPFNHSVSKIGPSTASSCTFYWFMRVMMPFYDFFAVFDPSPLTVCINCSFFYIYFIVTMPFFSGLPKYSSRYLSASTINFF